MRHAELNPIAALTPTAPTRPTQGVGGGDGGFARLFSDVQSEVTQYIQQGDSGAGASTLNAEGALLRARVAGLLTDPAATLLPGETDGQLEAESGGQGGAHGGSAGGASSTAQQAFLKSIAPWASQAAQQLGVAPELVAAHAALESGWGQRPLLNGGGATSNNLFGIKAGSRWNGAVSDAATTEYVNGEPIKTRERFRAYPDAASAFQDYAQMLLNNPRYRGVLNTGNDAQAFARGLAKGGYATDPGYATKLERLATSLMRRNG